MLLTLNSSYWSQTSLENPLFFRRSHTPLVLAPDSKVTTRWQVSLAHSLLHSCCKFLKSTKLVQGKSCPCNGFCIDKTLLCSMSWLVSYQKVRNSTKLKKKTVEYLPLQQAVHESQSGNLSSLNTYFESMNDTNSVCNHLKKKTPLQQNVWDQWYYMSLTSVRLCLVLLTCKRSSYTGTSYWYLATTHLHLATIFYQFLSIGPFPKKLAPKTSL